MNWQFVKPIDILYSSIQAAYHTPNGIISNDTYYRRGFNRLWKRLNVT